MKWWWVVLWTSILVIVVGIICTTLQQPHIFREIKRRYEILLDHLKTSSGIDPRFEPIKNHRPLFTGIDFTRMNRGTLGYNVNKGYEIFICLEDGASIDGAMHILIHELAHMTVPEYDHSEQFWKNFHDLRFLCINLGILNIPPDKTVMYCGGEIKI